MIESPNLKKQLSFEKKCLNIGLLMSSKISTREKQTTLKNIDLLLFKLHVVFLENLYNNIINNSSKSYTSSTKITMLNNQNHIYYGRRVEFPMLCYDVSNYDCCKNICINHDYNLLEKGENIIKRSHLTKKT